MPPYDEFLNSYTVATEPVGADTAITDNYLNVVAPTWEVGSVMFDGAAIPSASFSPIPGSQFSGAQVHVDFGSHVISGPLPFGLTVYGDGNYDGYGYEGAYAARVVSGGASAAEQGGATPLAEHGTTCSTPAPVNCATGAFWHTFTDSASAGSEGIPLSFSRTYSSEFASQDGPLGFGWSDSYAVHLTTNLDTTVTVTDEHGSQVTFIPTGDGTFTAPARVLASLSQAPDATYTFTRFQGGERYVFDSTGLLQKEIHRNGNTTTLTYVGGNLSKVTAASGVRSPSPGAGPTSPASPTRWVRLGPTRTTAAGTSSGYRTLLVGLGRSLTTPTTCS